MTQPEPFIYACHEDAEKAIRAFLLVMPTLIVDCAKDIHASWLDHSKPKLDSEAAIMERIEAIVRAQFPDEPRSAA